MTDNDKPKRPDQSHPLWHLMLSDTRTPEQRGEAESKERKRRKGKTRGREHNAWWKGLD